MKNNHPTNNKIDDKLTLRAFLIPEMFPFFLEVYEQQGKKEKELIEDIKLARECYKQLVSSEKKNRPVSNNLVNQ